MLSLIERDGDPLEGQPASSSSNAPVKPSLQATDSLSSLPCSQPRTIYSRLLSRDHDSPPSCGQPRVINRSVSGPSSFPCSSNDVEFVKHVWRSNKEDSDEIEIIHVKFGAMPNNSAKQKRRLAAARLGPRDETALVHPSESTNDSERNNI
ncbi:hypothetical protein VNI00_014307 [Paramarasmius palmivorus]|uniref:Uncharacterized protein n=1 Tax=Paramarasmius palmivorus TaxID=297713 RepID=A0AAW0BVL6_9AGAR